MKEILVTGGCGYIGSNVVLSLLEAGHRVVVIDDLSTGFKSNLQQEVAFFEGDFADVQLLQEVFKKHQIDSIIHMAAKTSVHESVSKPFYYYEENTYKTAKLLEISARYGIARFIFSSTAAVYQDKAEGTIDEEWPVAPINPYGSSKLFAERMLRDIAGQQGISCVVLRYFNVAGANETLAVGCWKETVTTLIQKISQNLSQGDFSIDIFGNTYNTHDKTCIRDYIHVSDIAVAHRLALDYLNCNKQSVYEIFNLGYGDGLSVLQIVSLFEEVTGLTIERKIKAPRPGDMPRSVTNPSKTKKLLGWKPTYDKDHSKIIATELAWRKKIHACNG